jgi:hypothetical protein
MQNIRVTNSKSTCALEIVNKKGKLEICDDDDTNSINIIVSERHYGHLHWDKRVICRIYYLCLIVAPYSEHFKVRYFSQNFVFNNAR